MAANGLWPALPTDATMVHGVAEVEIYQDPRLENGKPIVRLKVGDTVVYLTANTMEMAGSAAKGARLRWEDNQ